MNSQRRQPQGSLLSLGRVEKNLMVERQERSKGTKERR